SLLPFSDDFDRPVSTDLGPQWNQRGASDFDIEADTTPGDNLLVAKASKNSIALYNDAAEAQVAVRGDVNLTSGSVGLVARFLDDKNFYEALLKKTATGFQVQIIKVVKGQTTTLVNQAGVGSPVGTLEFEVVGPSLK